MLNLMTFLLSCDVVNDKNYRRSKKISKINKKVDKIKQIMIIIKMQIINQIKCLYNELNKM